MCRFLAVRSEVAVSLRPWLCETSHALVVQSRGDRCGDDHRDGWGLGWYDADGPQLIRSVSAAGDDPEFAATAARVTSRIAIAHVRNASVGSLTPENSHPFVHGPWMFCHNGTIEGFERLKPSFDRETFPELRAARGGATDSEHLFLWLLGNLVREGLIASPTDGGPGGTKVDVRGAAVVVCESLRRVLGWAAAADVAPPTGLNLVLTDGRVLLAVRHGRTLSWKSVSNDATSSAGSVASPDVVAGARPSIVIASEPIDDADDWREFEPASILTIDAYGGVATRPI